MRKNYSEETTKALKQIIRQLANENGISYEDFYADLQEDIKNGLKNFESFSSKDYPGTLEQYTLWSGLPLFSECCPPTPEEYILFGAGLFTSGALALHSPEK